MEKEEKLILEEELLLPYCEMTMLEDIWSFWEPGDCVIY